MVDVPSLALLVILELLPDHANHDLVADQTAGIHDLLGFPAEGGLLSNLRSEHVAGSLRKPNLVRQIQLKIVDHASIDIPNGSRRTSP